MEKSLELRALEDIFNKQKRAHQYHKILDGSAWAFLPKLYNFLNSLINYENKRPPRAK